MDNLQVGDWIPTAKRFVGFLDLMGFKDYVARHNHDLVYETMKRLSQIKKVVDDFIPNGEKFKEKKLYTTSFSDSLILFSSDDSLESFELISTSIRYILSRAIKEALPMKGALAHGLISVNKTEQIFFGQPLIDAYLLQEEVNYYGIIHHNSIEKYIEEKKSEKIPTDFIELKTPLKSGNITHNNLNWFLFLDEIDNIGVKENSEIIKKNFNELISKLKTFTSGNPRKYIDNTVQVFNQVYP
jgi:hypothetical protein